MQRLIIALVAVTLLFGCAPQIQEYREEILISGIELKRYANQGFLFTPYSYTGEYKPIGVVFATMFPHAKYQEAEVNDGVVTGCGCWIIGPTSTRKILDSLYNWAKEEGADAIVDLKVTDSYRSFSQHTAITLGGTHVTGFAIKRQ